MFITRRRAERRAILLAAACVAIAGPVAAQETATASGRVRARDLGVAPGIFAPGQNNAITDVAGVQVGQVTVVAPGAMQSQPTQAMRPCASTSTTCITCARRCRS